MTVQYKTTKSDTQLKVMSLFTTVLFVFLGPYIVYLSIAAPFEPKLLSFAVGGGACSLFLGILLNWYAVSIRYFAVDDERALIIIRKKVGTEMISVEDVIEIREAVERDFQGTFISGLFANGGLYSYAGTFRNTPLGTIRIHSTNRSKNIILKTKTHAYVLSPENSKAFIEKITLLMSR